MMRMFGPLSFEKKYADDAPFGRSLVFIFLFARQFFKIY